MRAFHESPDRISNDLTCFTLKAHITKSLIFFCCCLFQHLEASLTYSVDPDQTAPIGTVWSGFTLFASFLMLNNKQTLWKLVLCWNLKVKSLLSLLR